MNLPDDPFGTLALRERVLAAWNASPARLREDANAEEDAALGAYRDRLLVELAQNAADAADEAGVVGRLSLRLLDDPAGGPGRLLAANTGAPLSAEGVVALATLRASAKRSATSGTVGRFGVGFAAVLAVTDAPALRSTTGGVRFSRKDSEALLRAAGEPATVAEVDRRDGHLPTLRLPFPEPAEHLQGYDTVVDLPLRDAAARAAVEAALDDLTGPAADVLLLALPALREITVDRPGVPRRRLADVEDRWRVLRRSGRFEAADLADRGVEDRRRAGWSLTWALPLNADVVGPGVLCAPTPTDEDLPWPALLVATFPLGPDRRRLAPGRASEVLLDAAADAYGDLLAGVAADGGDALTLLPYGAAAGRVDAELRHRVLERARDVPLLLCVERVDGAPLAVRPSSAVALTGPGADDTDLLTALAPALAGLVAAPRGTDRLLTELGVTRMGLADVLDVLPGQDTAGSLALFTALASLAADPAAREAMSGLPVPLLDGRRVHGARGTVLLPPDLPDDVLDPEAAEVLAGFGLRVVDPAAATGPARDLLVQLGAREGGVWAVLTDPALRAAVEASPDADDPDTLAEAVLTLVAAGVREGSGDRLAHELPWLADLALPDTDDDLAPAGSLVLPGTLAARAMDPDEVGLVAPDLLQEWGTDVLRAVGVLSGPAVLTWPALDLTDLEEPLEAGLAGLEDYVEEVWADVLDEPLSGTVLDGVHAVRDLDLVVTAWPEVLAVLAQDPAGFRALTEPWVLGPHRRPGLVTWWLRRHGPLAGVHRDAGTTGPSWLEPAPEWTVDLPDAVRRALGILPDVAAATPADLPALLERAAHEPLSAADLLSLWAVLGRDVAAVNPVDLPAHAALDAAGAVVVSADVVVVDSPAWAQRTDLGPRLLVPAPVAEAVADLLDLDLASDRAEGDLDHPVGLERAVPAVVRSLVPGLPSTWTQVDSLRCDGFPVAFWTEGDDVVATGPAAAAQGLAQVAGSPWARTLLERTLVPDVSLEELAAALAAELPTLPLTPTPIGG